MDQTTFVCDRGSNLVKAFEDYHVVHRFPHTLNNVFKRTFYCASTQEKIQRRKRKQLWNKNPSNDQSTWNDFIINDDDLLLDYDDRDSSESEADDRVILDERNVELALRSLLSSPERDHINILEGNLPPYARQILMAIVQCKQLCCYVKRVFLILSNNHLFLFFASDFSG